MLTIALPQLTERQPIEFQRLILLCVKINHKSPTPQGTTSRQLVLSFPEVCFVDSPPKALNAGAMSSNLPNKTSLHFRKIFTLVFRAVRSLLSHQKPQTIHQIPNQLRGHERPFVGAVERSYGNTVGEGPALGFYGDEVWAIGEDVRGLGVVEAVVGVVDGATVRDGLHVWHVTEGATWVFDEVINWPELAD